MGLSCCKPSSQEACHHFPILAFWHSLWSGTLLKGLRRTSWAVRVSSQQRAAASGAGTCVLLGHSLCSRSGMHWCIWVLQQHQIHQQASSPVKWGSTLGVSWAEKEPRHCEIRWLGLCLSHQRSWGHTMGTLSWICLHLIPHGSRWAECVRTSAVGKI